MRESLRSFLLQLFVFILTISITTIGINLEKAYALGADSSGFVKKISRSYTNKFCNSIAFGLSKESAMNFSIAENKKVFERRKEMKSVDQELLAEEIAISVIEKCGYPINLSGDKGIKEFKSYYLSKDNELANKIKD